MPTRPWLSHYDADVRASLAPYPDTTLLDYLDQLAREHEEKPAILFKGRSLSYGELGAQSDAFAARLAALGIRPGSRVALILPNCPQFFVAEFGAWKAGAIVVPVNPTYSERELEQALESTRCEVAVVLTRFYERLKRVQGRTLVRHVVATNIKEGLPPLLRLLFTLFKERREGHRISLAAEDSWLLDDLRQHRRAGRPNVKVGPDDRAVILVGSPGTELEFAL